MQNQQELNGVPRAAVIVRETFRGRVGGLACQLNVVMHMGLEEVIDDHTGGNVLDQDAHKLLRGRVGGKVTIPTVDSEVLYILDGSVDMCWKDQRTPYTQYMHYHLLLASASGARFVLNGTKEMRPFLLGLFFFWEESRTLTVKFQQIAPAHSSAVKHTSWAVGPCQKSDFEDNQRRPKSYPALDGILKVSFFELLKSTFTLQGPKKFTFAKLLVQSLIRTYMLKIPEVASQPKRILDPRKASRADSLTAIFPDHVLHEITTGDGVTISARRWVNPDKTENPKTSNVVLLLNGYSIENFWLPTEPKDLVRSLLQSGYEPWLLNTRLSPFHIPDKQFNLDDAAKYDIPAAFSKIMETRGDKLPIHVIAHCIGGLHIHMAILGGYVHYSSVASLLCTNTSMHFSLNKLAMAKLVLPLIPISMAILGKNTTLHTHPTNAGSPRHQLIRLIAQGIPRVESCTDTACNTFSGVFGNGFWHANISPTVHANYVTPNVFPFCALPHLRKIVLKGHLVDAAGRNTYMTQPERLAVPTTYISGGREILVTQKTGRLAQEFMKRHHPQFTHAHEVVPDYGHSDLLIGETSYKDVFPFILGHLCRVREGLHHNKKKPVEEWELDLGHENSAQSHYYVLFGIAFLLIQALLLYMRIR